MVYNPQEARKKGSWTNGSLPHDLHGDTLGSGPLEGLEYIEYKGLTNGPLTALE
jgi:hypothetical protein